MPGPTSQTSDLGPISHSEVAPECPELPFPPLKCSHILNCSYAAWHPRHRSHVPKSRVILLPEEFIEYLREDGIFLPDDEMPRFTGDGGDSENSNDESMTECAGGDLITNPPTNMNTERFSAMARNLRGEVDAICRRNIEEEEEGIEALGGTGVGNTDSGVETARELRSSDPTERFKDLHQRIKSTIEELGGRVAPKLNWSAPKDASWISPTNSVECRTPSDIYLLLKSSDFITHDLEHPFDHCINDLPDSSPRIQYCLVLRKWFDINPSAEFRCFVRNRTLLAITQRDLNHYEFLETMRGDLVNLIQEFFGERLRDTFPDPDYAFDVYIPRIQSRVWLIDINPFALRTDPILFSWLEILNLDPSAVGEFSPELRLVRKNDPEAYSFNTPQYSAHKLPKEVVDAGLGGAESIQEFAMRWRDIVNNMPDSCFEP